MKPVLLVLLLCSSLMSFSQTQSEMNTRAKKEYREADKQLNEIYQLILKDYAGNKAFIQKMKEAQRIWVQFRDAQLKAMYPNDAKSYGSVYPMCEAIYLKELTEQRIDALRAWLNAPKPESCQGSIGVKQDN
ncbi:Uncharacterized conserved protein YecT, DUF1311 family [Chitinophaga terrae (ex Kim and Jung 2007)]|uniref:Uncharacterized conserved protein YecT, DUF1311 family n=1 Tax=Chitinophaga terrae (ex Kim and Jung 2007) TaxID=408074 RepID=A0A1H4FS28_9BACT|nr:lysozyme inhibitor LprI family protein [Chitinophaga terrae (ex Kim and Jung 2007)]MDQ0105419.1 uncharacterized protein YecT (DUF1311 family) [Chitinophaga terrae (ex Kim and Jung 2007)]SEB00126.1 Uncharacterized conserved protein YecT, DUF1311 family [Chitinophaga terrae (ex Kim and Jung 2007)]